MARLEYPPTSPTHIIDIDPPVFGNREEVQNLQIQRNNLDGNLITFRDTTWPNKKIFRMQFECLDDTERSNIMTFLSVSLGKPIKFTDHENREFNCLIIDPQGEFTEVFVLCGHTFEIVLQEIQNV